MFWEGSPGPPYGHSATGRWVEVEEGREVVAELKRTSEEAVTTTKVAVAEEALTPTDAETATLRWRVDRQHPQR